MLDQLSRQPAVWSLLRYIVEAGYYGERTVIQRELAPWQDVGQRRFLDLGCGTGAFADCFPSACYVGIDISRDYLAYARRSRAGLFAAASGGLLALRAASFDAALVVGVLHHLPDDLVRATMAELRRVLRPNATLLVMEDIPPPDLWNIAGHAMHWLDRGDHIRRDDDYRTLFGGTFQVQRSYAIRSGICDYGVYVLAPVD